MLILPYPHNNLTQKQTYNSLQSFYPTYKLEQKVKE